MKALIETAKKERYFKGAQNEFNALEKSLEVSLNEDLDKFSNDIRDLLKDEIVSRYYFQKGAILAAMGNDKEIKEALLLLQNPLEYSKLLVIPAKK